MLKAKSILVLEHILDDFIFIVDQLSTLGYSKKDFYNCTSLSDLSDPAVTDFSPEFIFADLNLPGSPSALDTFLYTQQLFPGIPIVVCADGNDDNVAEKCLELGAQNYLEKGNYSGPQLVKVITYSTERNQAKLELEKLKSDYQNLFNQNPLALLVVNKHTGRFHDVNKAAIEKYGYTHAEFTHLSLDDITKKIDDNNIQKCEEPGSTFVCHYKKNGEVFYVEVITTDISYKNIPSQLVTVTDVTWKVLAEEKERKAMQRLDAVFNGTHDAILLTDDSGRYVQVNEAASFMLGFTEEELLSLSVRDLVKDTVPFEAFGQVWKDFLETGTKAGIIPVTTKTGKRVVCHYNATAHVLPGLHLSILTDVTERENARQKIEEQGKSIEGILDSITDCFFAVDENWIIKYWNKAAERQMQLAREIIVGQNVWDVFKDTMQTRVYEEYHKVMNEREPVHFENYHPTSARWFDISAYPATNGISVYFKDITEKKKQSFEVQEAKNNQAALINSSRDLIWSLDTERRLISFNTAYKKTIEETTGKTVAEGMLLPVGNSAPHDQWLAFYKRGLSGEAFTIVIPILNPKTGRIKQAEIAFNPIFAVDNTTVKALACYSHDITERLQYQTLIEDQNKRLRENEERLQKLTAKLEKVMRSSLDIICSVDKEGTFVQVSAACKTILGYSPDELVGQNFEVFLHPEYIEATRKACEEAIAGKAFTNFQNGYIHKEGRTVPIIWSKNWDEEEQIMFCVGRDASSLIEAEKLKAETEQRFSAMVQKGADMVSIIDSRGMYKYNTPNIKEILGYEPEYLAGKNALDFIHPDDLSFTTARLANIVAAGEINMASFRFKHSDGEWRWLETVGTNMLHNPAIKGIVVNSRDITRRKEIEAEREQMIKELLKSNGDLKQFSFITSHNLRAPLSNIIGILNIIDYPTLDAYNRQMIDMIDSSAKQLGQTIDDLAKILIIKNNINIEVSNINLQESVDEMNKVFTNTLNDVCAAIATDFKVNEIAFNKVYFESIMVNLLSNAIKYRSPQRNLSVLVSSYRDADDNIVFKFADNGSGMDLKMHKNKLFGLYQRFHDHIEGQGLGLFIIKSQIVALGGHIDVESEPDQGTTFIITLKNHSAS